MSFMVMKLSSHFMKLHPSLFVMSAKLMIFNAMKSSMKLPLRLALWDLKTKHEGLFRGVLVLGTKTREDRLEELFETFSLHEAYYSTPTLVPTSWMYVD